jgi:hypothetical protein
MKISILLLTILSYLTVYGHVRAEEVQPEDFETQEDSGFIKSAFSTGATNLKDAATDVYGDIKTDYNKALDYDFSNPINIDTFKQSEIGQRFENQLTAMEGSPTYEAFVTRAEGFGIRNPVTTAISLNQCYDSALGDEEAINDLYDSIKALDTGLTSTIDKAEQLSSTLQLITSEDQSELLLQLFTIYVDQQNEESNLSTSKVLSPECIDAFNKFTVSVDSAKAILNGEMVQCKNFNSDDVSLTLCTAEPTTILKTNPVDGQVQIHYNVSGYLNNNGPKLCNVTFYVHNLDEAIEYYPEWLPFYDDRNPEGFQTGSSVEMWALVPKDAQEPTLPYLDIVNTFYVCDAPQTIPESGSDNTVPDSTTVNSPTTPTETKVNVETEANTNHISTSCFATVDCIREIASLAGDTCASYDKLLTSNCHTCNTAIVQNAKQECKDAGCSSQQCSLPLDLSSPASSLTASFCISVAAIASILVSIYIM